MKELFPSSTSESEDDTQSVDITRKQLMTAPQRPTTVARSPQLLKTASDRVLAEQSAAAVRIQSAQRQRQARHEVSRRRQRRKAPRLPAAVATAAATTDGAKEDVPPRALRLQAPRRGKPRGLLPEHDAAVRIQSVQRQRQAKRAVATRRQNSCHTKTKQLRQRRPLPPQPQGREQQQEHDAATTVQRQYRGRLVRRRVAAASEGEHVSARQRPLQLHAPPGGKLPTGACPYNRPYAQQYVGKSQSCMVREGGPGSRHKALCTVRAPGRGIAC